MNKAAPLALAAVTLLVGACEDAPKESVAPPSRAPGQQVEAPAEGKAEDGRFTMKGPGFDLKINLPEGVRNDEGGDNELLYPGASLSGMHIEAGADGGKAASGVELRFTSPDPVEKLAAWYRDPARKETFSVDQAAREGDAVVIAGRQKPDGDPFSLRLTPAGGGTEGRLTLSEKR